jgi:hypothetical protein
VSRGSREFGLPASVTTNGGLTGYGWSADKQIHWIMPIIGTGWVGKYSLLSPVPDHQLSCPTRILTHNYSLASGLGLIGIFLAVQTYLVDCYPLFAASVTAANTVVRSLVGAFLPLAGRPLYQSLGLGWGNSVLGFIALAMVPLPFVFIKYGARLRTHPRFQVNF